MTSLQDFRWEVCGLVTPHLLVRDSMWRFRAYRAQVEFRNRQRSRSRHYCGEAHAEVYISRWFNSVCAPPKSSFM
jgi:hypothetical protein